MKFQKRAICIVKLIGKVLINNNELFPPIREFIPDNTLRRIGERFFGNSENFSNIMFAGRSALKFNDTFLGKFPDTKEVLLSRIQKKHPNVTKLSPNEEYEIKSSTFDTLNYVFSDVIPQNPMEYYQITGLQKGKRSTKWIRKEFLSPRYPDHNNISKYKVFIAESNGNGDFGEQLSSPFIGGPDSSTTPTFQSVGSFDTEKEAINLLKYLKTKFLRTLLGIRKKMQHNPPKVWELIPLQDFTSNSDIDWSKSIPEIDQQLYKKYNLSPEEIDFIETHVKEME